MNGGLHAGLRARQGTRDQLELVGQGVTAVVDVLEKEISFIIFFI